MLITTLSVSIYQTLSDETDWPVEYKYRPVFPMEDGCVG
jgi:hypothetical protein